MAKKLIGLYNFRKLSKRHTTEQIAKAIYEDMMKKIEKMDKEKKG